MPSSTNHYRRSIRLKDYDYSQAGAYFVTVCVKKHTPLLGDVIETDAKLSPVGKIALRCWQQIPQHFDNVELDYFVFMPTHVHGIIVISEDCRGEVTSPLRERPTLGQIVAYFKYQSTKNINHIRRTPGNPLWQRNYYEHIIRNEQDLSDIRNYIINNPLQWHLDEYDPARTVNPI